MIEDTTWDVYEGEDGDWSYVMVDIDWPGGDREEFTLEDMENDWPMFHLTGVDKNYIIDQFGITDEITIQELYNTYINKIRPIIYDEMFNYFGSDDIISESVDRRKIYLDNIIEWLKEDTIFDHLNEYIRFIGGGDGRHKVIDIRPLITLSEKATDYFWDHVRDNYGLDEDEIMYVVGRFVYYLVNEAMKNRPITESTDRVHQFLDKVLDFLKEDTIFAPNILGFDNGDDDFIKLPFFDNPIPVKTRMYQTGYDLLMVLTDTPYPIQFERYCIDNYGLDKNSLKTIWEVYSGYLVELVSKKI